MKPALWIIADDLTGACDTGAGFAQHGLPTVVLLSPSTSLPPADVLVISTESRYLPADAAIQAVQAAVNSLSAAGLPDLIFKKIDSTLRGHPALELRALMETLFIDRALVTPAFPAQGRTVQDGTVLVNGAPLSETSFAAEVPTANLSALFGSPADYGFLKVACFFRTPCASPGVEGIGGPHGPPIPSLSSSPSRFGRGPGGGFLTLRKPYPADCHPLSLEQIRSGKLSLLKKGLYLADAETDFDLAALVTAGLQAGIGMWCGSAGLGRALAAVLPSQAPFTEPPLHSQPVNRLDSKSKDSFTPHNFSPTLIVAGSRHLATQRQLAALEQAGIPIFPLTLDDLRIASKDLIINITGCLQQGKSAVLCVQGLASLSGGESQIAAALGQAVARVWAQIQPSGLVLTGGDTAAAVCAALNCTQLQLLGEIQPGLALGHFLNGSAAGLHVVTKAGGFGQDDTLISLLS